MARQVIVAALCALLLVGASSTVEATSASSKIKHIVVLMLENRSFDHMLGFLRNNNTEIDGCTTERAATDAACTCPTDPQDPSSPRIPVDNEAVYIQPADPDHSFLNTTAQIYGFGPTDVNPAPMSGFIKSYAQVMGNTTGGEWIMKCFDPPHVPAITTLASEFAVIDHWYSGLPGPTEVNRAFANSGTSHGYVRNDEIVKHLGMPQRTIFESLEDGGSSWGVYFNDFPSVGLFRYVWTHLDHLHGWSKFAEDASKGELPAYTWLEPRYYDDFGKPAADQHPDHDVAVGDALIAEVYATLRASPTWNETLLLVTYDEHGGFFDHVPPLVGVPNPDGIDSTDPPFNFTRIGVRVPAVVASPWINANTVVHNPTTGPAFSHSSIPATVRKLFVPDQAALTHRTAWASTFDELLVRDTPRTDCPTSLPTPAMHRELFPESLPPLDGALPLTDLQKFFVRMAAIGSNDEGLTDEMIAAMKEREGSRYVINAMNKAAGRRVVS